MRVPDETVWSLGHSDVVNNPIFNTFLSLPVFSRTEMRRGFLQTRRSMARARVENVQREVLQVKAAVSLPKVTVL